MYRTPRGYDDDLPASCVQPPFSGRHSTPVTRAPTSMLDCYGADANTVMQAMNDPRPAIIIIAY